jgi:protein O-mannosyl-transferase
MGCSAASLAGRGGACHHNSCVRDDAREIIRQPQRHTSLPKQMSRHKSSKAKQRAGSREPGLLELWLTTGTAVEGSIGWRAACRPLLPALLALVIAVVIVYLRTFGAGFVAFDDDVHVYANPLLNPLSLESVSQFWRHAYQGLYIPLAYTIMAGIALFSQVPAQVISSLGQTVSFSPGVFHVASIGFHAVNTWLCFLLALRLTRSQKAALLCAFVFAVHPLQVESVAWISELRGLSSACFALIALTLLILSRQVSDSASARSRALLTVSAVFVMGAMLCKPAAMALPLVALTIDRVALGTSWRRSLVTALTWIVCVLPFAWITRSVQVVHPVGMSLWWQRPFIAGDALAFYVFKTVLPINLCVEYGRTPHSAMSQGWSYAVWAIPVGLLAFCFIRRKRHPMAWLGSLMFVTFLLPTLGLVPFKFQAHSTVADRYAYLPMIGIGLVVADAVAAFRSNIALRAVAAAIVALAIVSFNQSSYWVDNTDFLVHIVDVNPNVAFAHNNLANILLKHERVDEAIEHFDKALELDPGDAKAQNNLGLALVKLGRLDEAEPHYRKAVELNPRYFKAYENLGAVYLQTKRFDAAIASLKAAIEIQPSEAKALNDLGVAFMQSGRAAEGLDAFQRAVGIESNNAQYRKNLGYALLQQGRTDEARSYLTP